ncbi:MAG: CARDB domain-containing protein [Pseudomonadota bacterium]
MRTSTLILSSLFSLAALTPAFAVTVDVTATKGVTIGGAIGGAGGKFVPWGGSVVLSESEAFIRSNGKCAFNVTYDMQNNGNAATAQFKNYLLAKDATVAINSALALNAGQSKLVSTQPYLVPGTYGFSLKLDAENNLSESNETNNQVGIKVTLNGTCATPVPPPPPPKADLVSQKGVAIGGAVGGAGSHTVAWGGTVTLHAADAFLTSGGKCAFNIMYDQANAGNAAAGKFTNYLVAGTVVASQQTIAGLDKAKSTMVMTQFYLAPGTNSVRLLVDAAHGVDESNEANNENKLTVIVDTNCAATVRK